MKKGLIIFGILLIFGGILALFGIETEADAISGIGGVIMGSILIFVSNMMKKKIKIPEEKTNDYYSIAVALGIKKVTPYIEIDELPESFVVLDLETTGLEPMTDRICEIGILVVKNGHIINEFNTLVDPEIKIPKEARDINGITDEMVTGKPKIYEVMNDVYDIINNQTIVGYNVMFDIKFIGAFLFREKLNIEHIYIIDVLKMVRNSLKDKKLINKKLQTIKQYFGIKFKSHRALDDCKTTLEILKKCIEIDRIRNRESIKRNHNLLDSFNKEEDLFIKNVEKLFLSQGRKVEVNVLSDKTINFTVLNMQIGRVKLRGRKKKIQVITKNDVFWYEIKNLDEALSYLPKWERYYKSIS